MTFPIRSKRFLLNSGLLLVYKHTASALDKSLPYLARQVVGKRLRRGPRRRARIAAPFSRFDAIISSYLGETASNLRQVFESATHGTWVVFFDEFDAIGKSRDDTTEHGELETRGEHISSVAGPLRVRELADRCH